MLLILLTTCVSFIAYNPNKATDNALKGSERAPSRATKDGLRRQAIYEHMYKTRSRGTTGCNAGKRRPDCLRVR